MGLTVKASIPSGLLNTDTHSDQLPDELSEEMLDDFEAGSEDVSELTFNSTPIIFKLDDDVCGDRLDKVVAKLIPQFSRSRLQQWIVAGHVMVDGVAGRSKMTVLGGEEVIVHPQPAPEDTAYLPEAMQLDIVFEDKAILVINKSAGLVVHPAAGNWSGTLLKSLEAQTDLVRQLQARTVKREYLALVWGKPNLSGSIELPMARHPRDRIKMAVSESPSAKPAITHFKRLAVGALEGKAVSLVECRLETGRTHQIRVHMAHLGFPLVGDVLYGKQHLASYFARQALQARRLGLTHPVKNKEVSWQVDLAGDFAELLVRAGIPPQIAQDV